MPVAVTNGSSPAGENADGRSCCKPRHYAELEAMPSERPVLSQSPLPPSGRAFQLPLF